MSAGDNSTEQIAAEAIRDSVRINAIGPNSHLLLGNGGILHLTPKEAERAASHVVEALRKAGRLSEPKPKYAPAREDGRLPYVVEQSESDFLVKRTKIGWGSTPEEAKWDAFGHSTPIGVLITGCRRATPDDMQAHDV